MSNFGQSLREIRNERHLTLESLADMLGTSKQVLSRYENGHRIPKITTAMKYAEILGVSLARLNGDYSAPDLPSVNADVPHAEIQSESIPVPALTPDEEKLLSRYRALDEDDQELARAYLLDLLKRAAQGNAPSASDAG